MAIFPKKTRIMLQVNPVECAAVSFAIIADYYGYDCNLKRAKELVGVSRNGASAEGIIGAARESAFFAEAKRRASHELTTKNAPSILFFDDCHFVVFEGKLLNRYYINDPARGRYSLTKRQFVRRYSRLELTLRPQKKRFKWPKVSPSFSLMSAAFFMFGALSISFFALFSFLCLASFSSLFTYYHQANLILETNIWLILIIIISCAFVYSVLIIGKNKSILFYNFMSEKLKLINSDFFVSRPFKAFKQLFNAEGTNLYAYRSATSVGILFASLVIEFIIFWGFGLIQLALTIVVLFALYKSPKKISANCGLRSREIIKSLFADFIMMGQREHISKALLKEEYENLASRRAYENSYPWAESALFLGLCAAQLLYLKFRLIMGISYGEFSVALIIILVSFILCNFLIKLEPEDFSYENIESIINELKIESKEKYIEKTSDNNELIILKNISFSYAKDRNFIFQNLDLKLMRSKIYGLLGEPCSGKTSLLEILAGQLLGYQGQIYHHENFSCALIDNSSAPFAESLFENIRLYDKNISTKDIVSALKNAEAEDIFFERPLGLLSPILAQGKNLSVGERKRLLLARALAHKAQLVLLDNFFDALDAQRVQKILYNLKCLNITAIFSSYRVEDLAFCDNIILLKDKKAELIGPLEEAQRSSDYTYVLDAGLRL
jgi:ATP-binding cassette subfamily C protein